MSGIKKKLAFDIEAVFISFTISPLDWGLSLRYSNMFDCLCLVLGPFTLSIGWPFWMQEIEPEDDDNIISFEFRKRDRAQSFVDEDDYIDEEEDAEYDPDDTRH